MLVTGAGHGIGRELAVQLARLGAILVCVDCNNETNRATASQIRGEGGQSWAFQCDVSDRAAVAAMAGRVSGECLLLLPTDRR